VGPEENDTSEAEFYASLPQDPFTGPRTMSRPVVHLPESPEQLFQWLMAMPVTWIWRGQGLFDWHLKPRLAREFEKLAPVEDPSVSHDYIGIENRLIGFFKERARRSLEPPPDDLDLLSWLAVMQHYGAPTRLLDWTSSPFVGLWFAYAGTEEGAGALWGLNAYLSRREIRGSLVPGGWDHLGIMGHSTTDADGNTTTRTPALEVRLRDRENEFLRWAIRTNCRWPLPVIPLDADARMTAQQTVLTCIGDVLEPVDRALLHFEDWAPSATG
jgi:FRG domain